MKLNELKKIEEGIVSSIKGMFTGQGGYQTQVQDIFIKDFVQDALTSLNNGVKGGLIDPNAKSTGTSTTNFGNATASNVGPATGDTKTSLTPSNAANPLTAPTVSGAPKTSVSTRVTPGGTPGGITAGGPGMTMKESSYDKLNQIFESIVNIDEQVDLKTISEFMMDWFTQYMEGVNWQSSQAIVKQKLDKLQDEYPANVKQNLTDLAKIGLALSKTGTPAGAPPEFSQVKKSMGNSITDLKAELDGLAKSNPQAYNELLKSLRPANVNPAG